ncbi:MAG TPA: thioredoxin family protein [Guyparkeria sp.]|nr:thioredoxin family protein [Guyparkeria sp.]
MGYTANSSDAVGRNRTRLGGLLLLMLTLPMVALVQAQAQGAGSEALSLYTDEVAFVDHLNNLPADLAWMREHKKPMMVFFHASYCSYCQQIDDEFLIPMRLDPTYQGRLLIRRVQIDSDQQFIGVDGQMHDAAALADRLDVRGVPYVLFFTENGQRISEITGTAAEFYSHYLQRNVDLAERCAVDMTPSECQQAVDEPGLF